MGAAGLLVVMMAVAMPRVGAGTAVVHTDGKAKAALASGCPPAKLTPLRASKPTPAQRVMPDLH